MPTLDEQIEALKAVTLPQLADFHRQFYGASHGEVVVIGDFDPAEVQKQINALFGGWKSPHGFTRIGRSHQKIAPTAQVFETPDKANAVWYAALGVKMTDTDSDYPAMVLSGYIIGSGMNSRLFARIRGKEGLSYGVGASFSAPVKDDDAGFSAQAICAPQNAPKVEASFKDEMSKILEHGFTAEEVAAAKSSWSQSRAMMRATDEQLISRLLSHRYWGRKMTYDADLEQKVQALTPEQMLAALKRQLDLGQLTFFRAGDFKKANVAW